MRRCGYWRQNPKRQLYRSMVAMSVFLEIPYLVRFSVKSSSVCLRSSSQLEEPKSSRSPTEPNESMVEAEVSDHSPSSSEPPRLEAGVLASRWCLAAFFRSSFDMCAQKGLLCELVALVSEFYRLERKKKKELTSYT